MSLYLTLTWSAASHHLSLDNQDVIILGLHFGHDGSACIVKDGKLVSALAYERIYRCENHQRHKKCHGISHELIDYVLGAANVHFSEIDALAFSDYHEKHSGSTMTVTKDGQPIPHGNTWNTIFDNEVYVMEANLRGKKLPVYHPGHHLCHAASAYYTSPFQKATCLTMDSSGGRLKSNHGMAKGEGAKLTALDGPSCLIGVAYGQFTEKLGLGNQMFKAGSLMALAGYGKVIPRIVQERKRLIESAFFTTEMAYWRWTEDLWIEMADRDHFEPEDKDSKRARDIAASIQWLFEETILHCLKDVSPDENICLSGGSFLNCNANARVKEKFPNLHLFPACSDDGCSVGAALYTAHHVLGEPRRIYTSGELCYLGRDRECKESDLSFIASEIANGKIVAWMNGRAEFGPRALGNRSLLADPRNFHNREIINFLMKKREWFRPLAPSVLDKFSNDQFPMSNPFMLLTCQVRHPKDLPAVVHVDGSARPQIVNRQDNSMFYDLIKEFWLQTGCPMLLNTSLNRNGEPLLEMTEDSWDFWKDVPVDMMVLNGEIHRR